MDGGIVTPAIPARTPAIIDEESLAYLALRSHTDGCADQARQHGLGVVGHGGTALTRRFADHIRDWDRDRTATPRITAYPTRAAEKYLPGVLVIEKRHIRVVFSW